MADLLAKKLVKKAGQKSRRNESMFFEGNPVLRQQPNRIGPPLLVHVPNRNLSMAGKIGLPILKKLTVFGAKPGFLYSTTF